MNLKEIKLSNSSKTSAQTTKGTSKVNSIRLILISRPLYAAGVIGSVLLIYWFATRQEKPVLGTKRVEKSAPAPSQRQGIDPKAQKKLAEMSAAYAALNSYSDTTEIQEMGTDKPVQQLSRIQFSKPAKISVATLSQDRLMMGQKNLKANETDLDVEDLNREAIFKKVGLAEKDAWWNVSDGTAFYSIRAAQNERYLKQPVEAAEFGAQALMQHQPAGSLFTAVLTGVNTLSPPWGRKPIALYLASPTEINGEKVDIVVARFDNSDSPGEPETIAYEMSQRDHLLRRLVITRFVQGKRLITVETHKDIQINPSLPASTFAFSAPTGWQAVERWTVPTGDKRLHKGAALLPFEAKTVTGQPVSLKQYNGKAVLLMFWASWCPSCKRELPHVQQAYETYKDKGFEVIGVSLDRKQSELEEFLKKKQLPWHIAYDGKAWKGDLVQLYGVRSIPFSLLIGRDGKIAAINPQKLQLMSAVRRSLSLPAKTVSP